MFGTEQPYEDYYTDGRARANSSYRDINGRPVRRDPIEYRYSYDPYVTYRKYGTRYGEVGNWVNYSDRLFQWDHDKYNKAVEEVWGDHQQVFGGAKPADIERFLRLYSGNPNLELLVVLQGANVSNGYPYWVFFCNAPAETEAPHA